MKKLIIKGAPTPKTIERYNKLKERKDQFCNISSSKSNHPADKERKDKQEDSNGVIMGVKEDEYLESQLSSTIGRTDPNKIVGYPHKSDID